MKIGLLSGAILSSFMAASVANAHGLSMSHTLVGPNDYQFTFTSLTGLSHTGAPNGDPSGPYANGAPQNPAASCIGIGVLPTNCCVEGDFGCPVSHFPQTYTAFPNQKSWTAYVHKSNTTINARVRFCSWENYQAPAYSGTVTCIDPLLMDIKVKYGSRTLQSGSGIKPRESVLTITNGSVVGVQGLKSIGIWINGMPVFAYAGRRLNLDGVTEPLVFDVSKFLPATGESTVVVEGVGLKGAYASVSFDPPK